MEALECLVSAFFLKTALSAKVTASRELGKLHLHTADNRYSLHFWVLKGTIELEVKSEY